MLGLIPLPYKLLGGILAALAIILGSYAYGHHIATLGYEAAIARQEAQAQSLIAAANARIAAQEATQAVLNNKIEADHAKATQDIDAAHGAYNDAVANLMRERGRRQSSCAATSPASVDTGGGQGMEGAGLFISAAAIHNLGNLAAEADELIATMRSCQMWAVANGK